jgi:hypothetical protein
MRKHRAIVRLAQCSERTWIPPSRQILGSRCIISNATLSLDRGSFAAESVATSPLFSPHCVQITPIATAKNTMAASNGATSESNCTFTALPSCPAMIATTEFPVVASEKVCCNHSAG